MTAVSFVNKKQLLRKEIKARIGKLEPQYCHHASQKIVEKLISLEAYEKAKSIFCFVGNHGEVDTKPLILDALEQGKTVGVPLCIAEGIMEVRQIRNFDQELKPGMMGILEPVANTPVLKPEDIDFAIIPCVTCDHQGNRLGHGKGYYDRYLAGTSFTTCLVCFEQLVSRDIPMDELDQRVDRVITEAE